MNGCDVIVDGYNLLLRLAERERVRPHELDLAFGRARLETLLAAWADARSAHVHLVWDRAADPGASLADSPRLRVSRVEPPAEADDLIVLAAEDRAGSGADVVVVTADQGLRARLPRRARTVAPDSLMPDLEALATGPIGAPHLGTRGDETIPASSEPIDTSRLPRRRTASDEPPLPAAPSAVPGRPTRRPPEPAPPQSKAERGRRSRPSDEEKAARRRRWERAQARRKKRKGKRS